MIASCAYLNWSNSDHHYGAKTGNRKVSILYYASEIYVFYT
jgi:hypothetical protein